MSSKLPLFRLSLVAALLGGIGDASALGLGDIRTRSFLGEPLRAEVPVLTTGGEVVDASCFRLRSPAGVGDLPWLQRGSFNLRPGSPAVLEIRSGQSLRDPILRVGILVACGHEVQRDYTLLLSPRGVEAAVPEAEPALPAAAAPLGRRAARPQSGETVAALPKMMPVKVERRTRPVSLPDRLVLSGGGSGAADPGLRLATELGDWKEKSAREAERELLRLEFRMLTALNEQASSQLAAAEKLRRMEETLGALQSHAGDFASRIERGVPGMDKAMPAAAVLAPPPGPAAPAVAMQPPASGSFLSEWSFYGVLLGAALGIGGWLGWRQYRQRSELQAVFAGDGAAAAPLASAVLEEPQFAEFRGEPEVDPPVLTEVPPEVAAVQAGPAVQVEVPLAEPDSPFSTAGATVDEQFEANPVMELAEIMLSFGRVKGAAQALQEYIDHNPEEALQPWIRLMDVYRMAGMREEFERLAQDLNRHFNVEVQQWDGVPPTAAPAGVLELPAQGVGGGELSLAPLPAAPKALTVEDIDHIRRRLLETWGTPECPDYLHHLLRDNRGGKRSGFTLQVVEEILFLIELHEVRASIDK